MTELKPKNRRSLPWLLAGLFILGGAVFGILIFKATQRKLRHKPIAAYLIPVDSTSRAQTAWWHAKQLTLPLAIRSGELVTIPAGSKVEVVNATTGEAGIVSGPASLLLQQKLPDEPEALISPFEEVAQKYARSAHADRSIIITSPVGVTHYLNPLISWEAAKGKTYDIAVLDAADEMVPARTARSVKPPIALSELETPQQRLLGVDRNYTIVIRESGTEEIRGGARFLTAIKAKLENRLPATPADLMAEAIAATAHKPYRSGDAWLALAHLPPDWRKSELGVRIRLCIAAELMSPAEIDSANEDAGKIMQSR